MSTVRGTRSTSGDGTAIATATGSKCIEIDWLQLQNLNTTTDVTVILKFGSTEIYRVLLAEKTGVIPGLPKELRVSAANDSLYVNLSANIDTYYQIAYRLT